MSGTHSAPWGGKSRARHGAAQVVIGIAVAAGKVWAAKPENVLDLGGRGALRKELRAIHRSKMLQSGCAKRSAMCQRCIQAW